MMACYVQDGKAVDYRPTAAVAAGDVVVEGTLIGVAPLDIAANELGAIACSGVYDIAKGNKAFAVGAVAYWDAALKQVVDVTSKPRLGVVVRSAEANEPTVRVLLG
nr:MAG TPA: protein of unknown function DUF2190 [Caudoviricetes sp.]